MSAAIKMLPEHTVPLRLADRYGSLIGRSAAMSDVFARLSKIERSLVNVLIEGESGTGKELCARAIHEHSAVRNGPFVAVNCGALDRQLARSELFGHERGAFTGASEKCTGYFQKATGGSLFLDEVGELALDVQPVLLRALENGTVTPLGSRSECPVDVRVIAATNRSLEELVLQGRFREDLFYRIQVVRVDLPPLRARSSDISVIAEALALERANATLPQSVLHALERHHWPGNVRELRNVVDAFLALGNLELRQGTTSAGSSLPPRSVDAALGDFVDLDATYAEQKEELLGRFCRLYLARLLSQTNGNRTEAARISGIERSYLCKLVTKLSVPT